MHRLLTLLAPLAAAACLPSSRIEPVAPAIAPADPASEPQPRRYAQVKGVARLYAAPSDVELYLELDPQGAGAHVVEVLEQREGWSRVRSVIPREALALGVAADMGMAVIELDGWMPDAQLLALEAGASAGQAAQPVAPDQPARGTFAARLTIPADTLLLWPDGRVAGRAVEAHYFYHPPSKAMTETPEGPLELRCHPRRAAPGLGVITGMLCSPATDVDDALVVPTVGVALDELPRTVAEGAEAGVEGALDRDIIRRIVRAHIGEVRSCYNAGLSVDPKLTGRVAITFVIAPSGFVSSATVSEDKLGDAGVAQCIAAAVLTWQFPKPIGGGNVVVTYPFNLEPG